MRVIIIGRGHGGTRLISSTLSQSGIYMGSTNDSGDMVPAEAMYSAVKLCGSKVKRIGKNNWDFTKLISSDPTDEFKTLVNKYIGPLSNNINAGWKLPETLLGFPWIVKMFPDAFYIHWVRDIRDSISKPHITDSLYKFNIPSIRAADFIESRIESWLYQKQIVDNTPKPSRFIEINFEDFVLNQEETLSNIANFIGIQELIRIPVTKEKIGIYKKNNIIVPQNILDQYGYFL